ESNDWQKPARRSKFRCIFIKIGVGRSFWKAALRITPYFRQDNLAACRRALDGTFLPGRELC
ncbi:MAG: hypothetical protein ACREC2_00485, partial [Bradyrhizobium sp.]